MFRLFKTPELEVGFCDRCSSVCDASCRRDAILGRARDRALTGRML